MSARRGFALIELMIVVAIVALPIVIAIPYAGGGRFVVICRSGSEVIFQQPNAALHDGIVYYGNGEYIIPAGVYCENVYVSGKESTP